MPAMIGQGGFIAYPCPPLAHPPFTVQPTMNWAPGKDSQNTGGGHLDGYSQLWGANASTNYILIN